MTKTTEIMLANQAGPCNCCGTHTQYTEQLADEDGFFYCLDCVLIARIEELRYIDERMILNAR